jgi:hypothetical protein
VSRGARRLAAPLASAALCWAIGWLFLAAGQPHEDAFILFKYARMWAAGEGIAFFPGGPPTEGATDFGWLALLALAQRCGVDAALAALACNSIAAGIAAALILAGAGDSERGRWLVRALAVAVPLTPAAAAAYVGFSTVLYSTLALGLLALYRSERRGALRALPLGALALGLVRPDGVVIGATFALLGLARAVRAGDARAYLCGCALAVGGGAIYFAWRWTYFGELLPLPLAVKSHGGSALPGWMPNLHWLQHRAPRLVAIAIAIVLARPRLDAGLARLALGLLPFAALWAALCFAVHAQDVGARFHAPIALALHYALAVLLARALRGGRRGAALVLAIAAALIVARDARSLLVHGYRPATQADYIDRFAFEARACLPRGTRLALTEAGRMAFWSDAQITDLVGLNTARFAARPPALEDLRALDPDVVMLHHAGALDLRASGLGPIVEVEAPLAAHFVPWVGPQERFTADAARPYRELALPNVTMAAIAGVWFLSEERARYDVLAVRYRGELAHVYGIRRDFGGRECLLAALRGSFAEHAGPSYLELLGEAAR